MLGIPKETTRAVSNALTALAACLWLYNLHPAGAYLGRGRGVADGAGEPLDVVLELFMIVVHLC